MDVGRVGQRGLAPLDFEIISKKACFSQFRGVKTKFHHFWPALKNILGQSPTDPPLEKILPTPIVVYPSLTKNSMYTAYSRL